MLGAFFVNTAGFFMLSAIIDKKNSDHTHEVTTVRMPATLIEGFEAFVFFTLMILLRSYLVS